MTAQPWPTGVPQCPILNSVSEVPDRNVAEFVPEAGPPSTRRRTSIPTEVVGVELAMTYAQYEIFRAFYQDTLKDGALTFTYKDPVEAGASSPPTAQIFKFTEAPRFRQRSRQRCVISLSMRRLS